MVRPLLTAVVGVAALTVALPGRSQTTPPEARPDLSATWTLDAEISVDLAKVNLVPAANDARAQGRTRRGGSGGFGGGFGGRFGGRGFGGGSQPRSENEAPAMSKDEQARLKAMTDAIRSGWTRLVISLHDSSFVVNDARDRTQFFQTDGTPSENPMGDAKLTSSTRWEGGRLITEWSLGSDLTVVYSYTLLANMKQLVVRVHRKDGQNIRPFDPDVRLIYKRAP